MLMSATFAFDSTFNSFGHIVPISIPTSIPITTFSSRQKILLDHINAKEPKKTGSIGTQKNKKRSKNGACSRKTGGNSSRSCWSCWITAGSAMDSFWETIPIGFACVSSISSKKQCNGHIYNIINRYSVAGRVLGL